MQGLAPGPFKSLPTLDRAGKQVPGASQVELQDMRLSARRQPTKHRQSVPGRSRLAPLPSRPAGQLLASWKEGPQVIHSGQWGMLIPLLTFGTLGTAQGGEGDVPDGQRGPKCQGRAAPLTTLTACSEEPRGGCSVPQ